MNNRAIYYIFSACFLIFGCGAASKTGGEGTEATPSAESSGSPTPADTISSPSPSPSGSPNAAGLVMASSLSIPTDTASIVVTPTSSSGLTAGVKASSFATVSGTGQVGTLNIFTETATNLTQSTSQPIAKDLLQTPTWIVFVHQAGTAPCDLVLMRKSDKKLFCGGSFNGPTSTLYTGGRGLFQSDSSGNLYYFTQSNSGMGSATLARLTLSDPANPTATTLYEFQNSPVGYIINQEGDAFILDPASGSGTALIKKTNGGIQNVAGSSQVAAMLGSDNAFYWIKYGSPDIKKLARGSDGSFTETTHAAGAVTNQAANMTMGSICSTSTNVFGGDTGTIPSANAYRFVNSPGSLDLANEGYGSWSALRCGSSKVYVLGQNGSGAGMIKAFDDNSSTWTTLLNAGEFTVRNFEVSLAGEVYFDGLRNSDGKKVFAKATAGGGAPTIISESFFEPQKLMPLN